MKRPSNNPTDKVTLTQKGVKHEQIKKLESVLDVLEHLDFPSNPDADDFFDDNHLLGMQFLELSLTFLLRSRRIYTAKQSFPGLGKFSLLALPETESVEGQPELNPNVHPSNFDELKEVVGCNNHLYSAFTLVCSVVPLVPENPNSHSPDYFIFNKQKNIAWINFDTLQKGS